MQFFKIIYDISKNRRNRAQRVFIIHIAVFRFDAICGNSYNMQENQRNILNNEEEAKFQRNNIIYI